MGLGRKWIENIYFEEFITSYVLIDLPSKIEVTSFHKGIC